MSVIITRQGVVAKRANPVLKDNTWAEIIGACQTGRIPPEWAVGDLKEMTINGTSYEMAIIGMNHDDYADGTGKAPITFQMQGIYADMYVMNTGLTNQAGWEGSEIRTIRIPAIIQLMPQEVQTGLREVNKPTTKGNRDTTVVTTADKLFLPSEIEVFGTTSETDPGEGVQYEYYKLGNSTIKTRLGPVQRWWLRSPIRGNAYNFCVVNSGGALTHFASNDTHGISFAFCF